MALSRFSIVLLLAVLTAGPSYSETVYHLKSTVAVNANAADVRDAVEEALPDGIRFPMSAGRSYSNMEICGILNLMGLKDYALVGNTVCFTTRVPEEDAFADNEAVRVPDPGVYAGKPESFFLKIVDRGNGDVFFRKGNITIVTRVKIVRGDREGYLVMNPFSGRKYKVAVENRSAK